MICNSCILIHWYFKSTHSFWSPHPFILHPRLLHLSHLLSLTSTSSPSAFPFPSSSLTFSFSALYSLLSSFSPFSFLLFRFLFLAKSSFNTFFILSFSSQTLIISSSHFLHVVIFFLFLYFLLALRIVLHLLSTLIPSFSPYPSLTFLSSSQYSFLFSPIFSFSTLSSFSLYFTPIFPSFSHSLSLPSTSSTPYSALFLFFLPYLHLYLTIIFLCPLSLSLSLILSLILSYFLSRLHLLYHLLLPPASLPFFSHLSHPNFLYCLLLLHSTLSPSRKIFVTFSLHLSPYILFIPPNIFE